MEALDGLTGRTGTRVVRQDAADEVFAALTRRHVDGAYRLAWAILRDNAEADDATQDAFALAWRKRSSLRDADRFDAWFGRFLVNVCRDRLRAPGPAAFDRWRKRPKLRSAIPRRRPPTGTRSAAPSIGWTRITESS
jgi:DNA-directed RNA polymerase specialized sigma24 family protein